LIQIVTSTAHEDIQAVVNVSRDNSENCPERKFWGLIGQAFLSILILRKAYCFEVIKKCGEKASIVTLHVCVPNCL